MEGRGEEGRRWGGEGEGKGGRRRVEDVFWTAIGCVADDLWALVRQLPSQSLLNVWTERVRLLPKARERSGLGECSQQADRSVENL